MTAKQDRQGARTVADLERKYNIKKSFATVMGVAEEAERQAVDAMEEVQELDDSLNSDELLQRITSGSWQGMYKDEATGEVYINASYLKAGIIDAAVIRVVNLIAEMLMSAKGDDVVSVSGAEFTMTSRGDVTMKISNQH